MLPIGPLSCSREFRQVSLLKRRWRENKREIAPLHRLRCLRQVFPKWFTVFLRGVDTTIRALDSMHLTKSHRDKETQESE